jgi:hypothetical protein
MKNCTLGFFSHLIESNHVKLHARLSHFNEINVKNLTFAFVLKKNPMPIYVVVVIVW